MSGFEQFDFSKEKDQKKFDKLPEKEKTEIVETSQMEASLMNKIKDKHPSGGDLYSGGVEGIDDIVSCNDKEALAYSMSNDLAYRGGASSSGISYYQTIRMFNGKKDMEIKPWGLWRDGENQYNDNPSAHYFIEDVKKSAENKYELVLKDGNNEVQFYEVDFKKGQSVLKKEMSALKYMEKKEGKSNKEKHRLLGEGVEDIMKEYNKGTSIEGVFVINLENKAVADLSNYPYYDSSTPEDIKEDEEWDEVLNKPENKILIIQASNTYELMRDRRADEAQRNALLLADPKSLKVKMLKLGSRDDVKYKTAFLELDLKESKIGRYYPTLKLKKWDDKEVNKLKKLLEK